MWSAHTERCGPVARTAKQMRYSVVVLQRPVGTQRPATASPRSEPCFAVCTEIAACLQAVLPEVPEFVGVLV